MSFRLLPRVWAFGVEPNLKRWAYPRPDIRLSSIEKTALVRLADAADDDGSNVRLSVERVARDICVTGRSVQKVFRRFKDDLGLLLLVEEADFAKQKPRVYRLNVDLLPVALPPEPASPGERASPGEPHSPGEPASPARCPTFTGPGEPDSPNPLLTPLVHPSEEDPPVNPPLNLLGERVEVVEPQPVDGEILEPKPGGKSNGRSRRAPAGRIPPDWQPSAANAQLARKYGFDVDEEELDFRAWTSRDGYQFVDWHAAFTQHLIRRRRGPRGGRSGGGRRDGGQIAAALGPLQFNREAP